MACQSFAININQRKTLKKLYIIANHCLSRTLRMDPKEKELKTIYIGARFTPAEIERIKEVFISSGLYPNMTEFIRIASYGLSRREEISL